MGRADGEMAAPEDVAFQFSLGSPKNTVVLTISEEVCRDWLESSLVCVPTHVSRLFVFLLLEVKHLQVRLWSLFCVC